VLGPPIDVFDRTQPRREHKLLERETDAEPFHLDELADARGRPAVADGAAELGAAAWVALPPKDGHFSPWWRPAPGVTMIV
jgi:hypothetical protein